MKDTAYYNYYNISYRYTSNLPEKPDWKRKLELVEDKVKSNNHDPESERYKAFEKLVQCKISTSYPQNHSKSCLKACLKLGRFIF